MTNVTNNNQPAARLKDGLIQVAIWKNESGKGKTYYSVSKIQRTYNDNGSYKETDSLSGTQLLQGARLLVRAYDKVRALEAADYQARQEEPVGNGGSS